MNRCICFCVGLVFNLVFFEFVLAQVSEFELENGVRVIVNSVPEAEVVGVEAIYEVGFVDEPCDMTQASHLLEHLVCYAPGAGFEQKEAMAWLNSVGMANAETMPDWTHYDYSVPAESLEKVFEIEGARLTQKGFDKALINAEAKRVYSETDMVESNPQTGMVKHGFMAIIHSWKFSSKSSLVRGGLEDFETEKLLDFYRGTYVPDNLTFIVTGGTTVEVAKELAQRHLGDVPRAENRTDGFIDWDQVAAKSTIQWDAKHSAVCIAWSPQKEKRHQVVASLISTLAMQSLMQNKKIKKKCHMVFCSNTNWHVGDLPLFVYAMPKVGEDLTEVEQLLESEFEAAMEKTVKFQAGMMTSFASQYEFQLKPTAWARVQAGADMLTKQMQKDRTQAFQMILTQDALNRGTKRRLLGGDPSATIEYLKSVKRDQVREIISDTMKPAGKKVVHVMPMEAK